MRAVRRFTLLSVGAFVTFLTIVVVAVTATKSQSQTCGAAGPVGGVPAQYVPIFQGAGAQFQLGLQGPSVLAAINNVESTFGTSTLPGVASGTNSAGAAGPMQIGVGGAAGDTWDRIKVSAPGDPPGTPPSVYSEADAVYSAANYLHMSGAPGDWQTAIFSYNHSQTYVDQVLGLATKYYQAGLQGAGGTSTTSTTSTSSTTGTTSTTPGQAPVTYDPGGACQVTGSASAVAMLQAAQAAAAAHIPYSTATNTSGLLNGWRSDCSGFVSWVLNTGGVKVGEQTTVTFPATPGIMPGVGQQVTLWNRPLPGQEGHVIIDILGQWFESGGQNGVGPTQMTPAEVQGELGVPSLVALASSTVTGNGFTPLHPAGL